VEATSQICLRFSFVVRSFGVALCWKSKDCWCQKEVHARTFLAVGKTRVIITVLIWCLPRILDNLLCSTSVMQIFWLQTEGHQEVSFYPIYCAWSLTCLCTNLWWVYVLFSAEFNCTISFFDSYIYINAYHWNK